MENTSTCERVTLFMMSKFQCEFCFENCTTEESGGEKGGSTNLKRWSLVSCENALSPLGFPYLGLA